MSFHSMTRLQGTKVEGHAERDTLGGNKGNKQRNVEVVGKNIIVEFVVGENVTSHLSEIAVCVCRRK